MAWLKRLAGLRDGILVVSAGLYVIGYLLWSLYAWSEGLGLLPVLSAQYFAVAITMAAFPISAWGLILGLWRARAGLHEWFRTPTEARRTIRWLIVLVFYLSFWAMFLWGATLLLTEYVLGGSNPIKPAFFFVALGLFAGSAFLGAAVEEPPQWLAAACKRLPALQFFLSPDFPVGSEYLVATSLFPWIIFSSCIMGFFAPFLLPQALGGFRSRCVQLDVDRTMMSRESQEALLLPNSADANLKVDRSIKLDVLFSGGNSVLVRRHDRRAYKDLRVYAIGSKFVTTTVDCE